MSGYLSTGLGYHCPGAYAKAEAGDDGAVWVSFYTDDDQRPAEATLSPAEARAFAAALVHIANEQAS